MYEILLFGQKRRYYCFLWAERNINYLANFFILTNSVIQGFS